MQIKQLNLNQNNMSNLDVWLVEDNNLPIINIELLFIGGSSLDFNKYGLTYLMAGLLDEGAGNMNNIEFHNALDKTATYLNFSVTKDAINISIKMLKKYKEYAADLLNLALFQPLFEEESIDRVKEQIISSIRNTKSNPLEVAYQKIMKLSFGNHIYGNSIKGNENSISKINKMDLHKIVKCHFNALNPYLVVVGDINDQEVKDLVLRIFVNRHQVKNNRKLISKAKFVGTGKTEFHYMNIPQTVINFSLPFIKQDNNNDYIKLIILNHIFGGSSFSSRLMKELRERYGLTYDIHTSINLLKYGSLIIGNTATSTKKVQKTINILHREIKKIHDYGITDKELSNAKKYLKGSYLLGFDTGSRIAKQLLLIKYFNFGIDFINVRSTIIDSVLKDDISNMAINLLDINKIAQVIVGSNNIK